MGYSDGNAMELFGNKLIGGAVQGQKALEGDELLRSQLAVLKKDNEAEYKKFMRHLRDLKDECAKDHVVNAMGEDKDLREMCEEFKGIFNMAG